MSVSFSVFRIRFFLIKLVRFLLLPLFKHARLEAKDAKRIEELQEKGSLIFVLRSASIIDAAFMHHILDTQNLKTFSWTNAKAVWSSKSPAGTELPANNQGLLFMKVGGGVVTGGLLSLQPKLEQLVEWTLHSGEDIYVCPVISIWEKVPQYMDSNLFDILLGRMDKPGLVRRLYWLFRSHKNITAHLSTEIDVRQFAADRPDLGSHEVARIIRLSLARHFAAEQQSVIGPRIKSTEKMIEQVVQSTEVQSVIEEIANESGVAQSTLQGEAEKCAKEIAATPDFRAVRFLEWALTRIWATLFSGFHVDLQGLQRVQELMKKGPILIVPCHKSHIDYLFISYLFKVNNIPTPHIAAGINLTFWPMGPIFRRAGAFFLRRTFAGDRVYKVVFQTYLKTILHEGFNVEFFIEGTRSRSGRMMAPRFGMLQMLNESYDDQFPEVSILPVSIDYDMLVEQKSIEQELLGEEKQAENLKSFLGLRKKLGDKYGGCYLRFGDPFSFNEYKKQHEDQDPKEFVERLGYEITGAISQSGTTSYSSVLATALCIHHKRGISRASLDRKFDFLITLLKGKNARMADTFPYATSSPEESLELFLRTDLLEEVTINNEQVYMIPDGRRLILDYYKNNSLHYLAPLSVAAWAFRATEVKDGFYQEADLWSNYSLLWEPIKNFFNRKFSPVTEVELREQLDVFAHWDWIDEQKDGIKVVEQKPLMALENLLINYYESLYVMTSTVLENAEQTWTKKQWIQAALELANVLYAKGDIWRYESRSKANLEGNFAEFTARNFLRKDGQVSKRKRDQQCYRVSEERHGELKEIFDTLHDLLIDRKYISSTTRF
jgi:glycerol-3-phosphate O-acyltransferase